MLTYQEKDEVMDMARKIMRSNRDVEWEGWKQLMEDELLERGWPIEKQIEALKVVGLFTKKTL